MGAKKSRVQMCAETAVTLRYWRRMMHAECQGVRTITKIMGLARVENMRIVEVGEPASHHPLRLA